MVQKYGEGAFRIVFTPRHLHARVALHSVATASGAAAALRMGAGGPWWLVAAWYCGLFVGAHAVMVPFMALWYMGKDRVERWIRGVVEEELIRFDLQTCERQLERVFPARVPPDDRV